MSAPKATRKELCFFLLKAPFGVVAITLLVPALLSAAVMVPVKAHVQGVGANQTIGEIVADGGFAGLGTVGAGLRANFNLAPNFGYLDDRYDFDWVSVLTKQDFTSVADGGNDASGLFPNPPNIDPISQESDNLPFFYNDNEWRVTNKYGGVQIHAEREYSRFLDVPSQPADRKFHFLTFLVLRDHGAYTLDGMKTFCVLAGFSWQYQGAARNPDDNRGTSTAVDSVTINQGVIDILSTALSSGGAKINDPETMFKAAPFTGWSAIRDCTLVPEPSTLGLLLTALAAMLPQCRRRSRAP